jgi:hypothetical protein
MLREFKNAADKCLPLLSDAELKKAKSYAEAAFKQWSP